VTLPDPGRIRAKLGELTLEGPPPVLVRFGEELPAAPVHSSAGVLIGMTERDDGLHLLYTRRTEALRKHSGQVSFPGGRHDAGDPSLVATALREASEEVDLSPGDVSVFGQFASVPTVSGFQIHAFVGEYASPYAFTPEPGEVDYIREVALAELVSGGIHTVETRVWEGVEFPMHTYALDPHPIWGATAYMTHSLLAWLGVVEG